MLRNLIFMLSLSVGSVAFANGSRVNTCINALQYYFLAPYGQAQAICLQNSSNDFLNCMENKAATTNLDITEVVPMCSRKVHTTPKFNTCEARLQKDARMSYDLSLRTCQWDSSSVMISCIIDVSNQARFHPTHALQYCAFAKSQYPQQMNYFKSCVAQYAPNSHGSYLPYHLVHSTVQHCHDRITGVYVEPVLPPVETRRPKPVQIPPRQTRPESQPAYPYYPEQQVQPVFPTHPQQPQPQVYPQPQQQVQPEPQQPAVQPEPTVKPSQIKTGTVTKVPVPVEIKVQESSKPEVTDQPLQSESTSNAESLPL